MSMSIFNKIHGMRNMLRKTTSDLSGAEIFLFSSLISGGVIGGYQGYKHGGVMGGYQGYTHSGETSVLVRETKTIEKYVFERVGGFVYGVVFGSLIGCIVPFVIPIIVVAGVDYSIKIKKGNLINKSGDDV